MDLVPPKDAGARVCGATVDVFCKAHAMRAARGFSQTFQSVGVEFAGRSASAAGLLGTALEQRTNIDAP